jgi:hypothetical protein
VLRRYLLSERATEEKKANKKKLRRSGIRPTERTARR